MEFERTPIITKYPNIGSSIDKARYYRANLDYALQDGLYEFYNTAIEINIDNKKWLFHKNVNLYIDCISKCLFDCEFCIAKTTDGRKGKIKKQQVEDCINYLLENNVYFTTQVTGGEPELHEELEDIFYLLPNNTRVINTNIPSNTSFLFDHVNVSCHHYNSILEKEIIKKERDRVKLKENLNIDIKKVRLQCNLIGNYIDTYGEIMQYIAFSYHKLNITNISFSFLTELPNNTMYKKSIIKYVKNHKACLFNDIVNNLEKTTHWKFKKYRGGVACYYEIWEYMAYEKKITVQFKYSNNYYLNVIDKKEHYVPDLILHPCGTLTAGWDKRIKKLKTF